MEIYCLSETKVFVYMMTLQPKEPRLIYTFQYVSLYLNLVCDQNMLNLHPDKAII